MNNKIKLLGFDNPLGDYPAPVVPVCEIDGKRVAVYRTTQELSEAYIAEPISLEARFTRLTDQQSLELADYDPASENLLAISPDEILRYKVMEAATFFRGLYENTRLKDVKPFTRLNWAKQTGDQRLLNDQFKVCFNYFVTPQVAQHWLKQELRELQESGFSTVELEGLLLQ